jgi:hypothetical protein
MTERYRDFDIDEGYPGTYQYVHKDYDGPEDSRAGWAFTVAECKAEVDEWHEDQNFVPPVDDREGLGCRGVLFGLPLSCAIITIIAFAAWIAFNG